MKKIANFLQMPLSDKNMVVKSFFYPIFNRHKYGSIGKGSYVNHPIKIVNPKCIKIGDYSNIGHGARIDCIRKWNDKNYNPHLSIGNGVSIGQNCTLSCADSVKIGDNVVIAFGSYITDNEHEDLPVGIHLFEKGIKVKPVTIGNNTFIGCNSVVLRGVSIGENCIIGAGSIVKKDVPDNTMVAGIPAKMIKRYNAQIEMWEKDEIKIIRG